MLPAELLLEVCNHLEALDIFALSLVCHEHFVLLEPVTSMFKTSPWYQRQLSSWSSWQTCAANYTEPLKNVIFERGTIPQTVNKPLPDDFTVLQEPPRERSSQDDYWINCDRGIYAPETGMSLDLRAEPTSESVKPVKEDHVTPDPLPEGSDADLFGEASARVSSEIVWNAQGELSLVVKDCHGHVRTFPRNPSRDHSNRVFDGVVFTEKYDMACVSDDREIEYLLPGAKTLKPLPSLRKEVILVHHWLMYNGALFKAVVGRGNRLMVGSLDTTMKEGGSTDCCFSICQDSRNPRYGLAHRLPREGLQYVIDLEKQLVYRLPRSTSRDQLHLVGISDGQLGVWSFDQQYLRRQKDMLESLEREQGMVGTVETLTVQEGVVA